MCFMNAKIFEANPNARTDRNWNGIITTAEVLHVANSTSAAAREMPTTF